MSEVTTRPVWGTLRLHDVNKVTKNATFRRRFGTEADAWIEDALNYIQSAHGAIRDAQDEEGLQAPEALDHLQRAWLALVNEAGLLEDEE